MSAERLPVDYLDQLDQIKELCRLKASDFALMGYANITSQDIWRCVSERYGDSWPPLHKLVNDILTLTPTKMMNWLMLQAYKDSALRDEKVSVTS
ncbi:MAG TPA: post-transcriptional regulator [Calditerricola sp.]